MKKLIFTLALILLCNASFSQDVIDARLQEAINQKNDEMIDVNIVFKSQIDLTELKTRAQYVSDKKVRRDILVDELKFFAEEKQQEVLSILKTETRSSKVANIRTHWLSNAISCTVSRDVIYLLAEHPDIELIGWDEKQQMIFDESVSGQQSREEIDMTDNIKMVKADKVWEMGYTGKGVVVAIIDTGVNYNHADLKDHLWDGGAEYPKHGYNVIDNNNDPMDGQGHGTHCAGTLCGDGTSGILTGIAPDVTLMCVKALDNKGQGTASSINASMEFAIEHGADILSMSLGFSNTNKANKTMLRNTCVNALELGVIAAVAAGNDGDSDDAYMQVPNNISSPSDCPPPWLHPDQQVNASDLSCVVSVGAVDFDKKMYEYGSIGPVTWTDTEYNDYPYNPGIGLIRPDVCAPGVGIKSLDGDTNDGYNLKSGTSMATPCVAGVMALMLEKQNDLTPAEICMALETTAEKLSETKSNQFGSGLIDAYKAITSITKGSLTLNSITINDSDFNNNGQLNPGEKVKVSLNVHNNTDKEYNDLKAVLSCSNNLVTITDAEAAVGKIDAESYISLTDEFEFFVTEDVENETDLSFDLHFYDQSENDIALLSFSIKVKDDGDADGFEFASYVVKNDDNNNGILEAGETADLGLVINNISDKIAVKVKGVLTNTDNSIIINKNEAEFSSIGAKSSGIAFFNVTVPEDLSSVLNIPFKLNVSDMFGNENEIACDDYVSRCTYIFQLEERVYDGWDGSSLLVKYSNGDQTDTMTLVMADYGYKEYRVGIGSNVEVTLEWLSRGEQDSDCKFTILTESYELFYTSPELADIDSNKVLFSWVNNCLCKNEAYKMCDAVENLAAKSIQDGIKLTWSKVNGQKSMVKYEIYREASLLSTMEDTVYVDVDVVEGADYVYSVRPVYEDCTGYFADVIASYSYEGTDPDDTTSITERVSSFNIYPNPVKDEIRVSSDEIIEEIVVYDVYGRQRVNMTTIKQEDIIIDVTDLNGGIYFVKVKLGRSEVVKRFVKK